MLCCAKSGVLMSRGYLCSVISVPWGNYQIALMLSGVIVSLILHSREQREPRTWVDRLLSWWAVPRILLMTPMIVP